MPIGFNTTIPTMANITSIGNSSSFPEIMVKINNIVFNGYLFFTLCFIFAIIIFLTQTFSQLESGQPTQPLHNAMYAMTTTAFLSVFLRAVEITYMDYPSIRMALLKDSQMYIFLIASILLGGMLWLLKRD
jgi:hypothetical protein